MWVVLEWLSGVLGGSMVAMSGSRVAMGGAVWLYSACGWF